MDSPKLNPKKSLSFAGQCKGNQLIRTQAAFFKNPATMRMIEIQTGILRPSICRYVRTLRKSGSIEIVRIGYCPDTKHLAGFYSTNPALFLPNPQMNLFEGGQNHV